MGKWTRRSSVCNPADPTQVTSWEFRLGRLHLKLLCVWDVEGTIHWRGFTYRTYGTRLAKYLFELLEDRWERKNGFDPDKYDPEVEAAERAAGWDPNP